MKFIRETSDFVCNQLISKLPISDNISILEPSIGDGKIIQYLLQNWFVKNLDITGIELNKERLAKAGENLNECSIDKNINLHLIQADFLTAHIDKLFDVIAACPPFKGNIDLLHIQKMYDLLKYRGMMATLTSPYWITNNEPIQVEFREWLKDKDYQFKLLPDFSFVEKDKSVPTGILTIYKRK